MNKTQQKFFHIYENGEIEKQGIVLNRSQGKVTVEFFSWLTGFPHGQKTFNQDETQDWRFYKFEADWKNAGDEVF